MPGSVLRGSLPGRVLPNESVGKGLTPCMGHPCRLAPVVPWGRLENREGMGRLSIAHKAAWLHVAAKSTPNHFLLL